MSETEASVRMLSAEEAAVLAPQPESDRESPTTAMRGADDESTAEVHTPGILQSSSAAEDDPVPDPVSIEES